MALPDELEPYKEQVLQIIESASSGAKLPSVVNARSTKINNNPNANFKKKEFQELGQRINHKATYRVDFSSAELIEKCTLALNDSLNLLKYETKTGEQDSEISRDQLDTGTSFVVKETSIEYDNSSVHATVKYDLIGIIAAHTELTRKTVASILSAIKSHVFDKFKANPEDFITQASRLILEQKATAVVESLSYTPTNKTYTTDIFTANHSKQEFSLAMDTPNRHIYDYLVSASKAARKFAERLESSTEVIVYSKLPSGFKIPTPGGNYNPDWAIAFTEGSVQHIYFVAETKGYISSLQLRNMEEIKTDCAKKFFEMLHQKFNPVKYGVVKSYGDLLNIVTMVNESNEEEGKLNPGKSETKF